MNRLARNMVFSAVAIAFLACQMSRADDAPPRNAAAQEGKENRRSEQRADNAGGEKKKRVRSLFVLPGSVAMQKDIVYGQGGGRDLKADLFLPKDSPEDGPMPAMIYIHGGGWRSGKKDVFHRQAAHVASKVSSSGDCEQTMPIATYETMEQTTPETTVKALRRMEHLLPWIFCQGAVWS